MTINQLIECLFCKYAVQNGCAIDSTPFVNQGPKYKLIGGLLNEYGIHSSGNEILYNGMTGEQIESEIYMGPTYYTRLKHMTQDKINYRARGPRAALTRQTNHGRSKDGGLRIGDMERDSILSHGMSSFMYDSMMTRGDYYRMAICNHSGTIAIYNKNTQNFYSPLVDGPLQFESIDAQSFVPNLISKYGKNFSIVEVPYCLKLLIHELTTMNVQMRLITADNVDSLTTAGKRSLGEFKTWVAKPVPENLGTIPEVEPEIEVAEVAENSKEKVEQLLNQPLTDEEYKALSEPLEEYEPELTNATDLKESIPNTENPEVGPMQTIKEPVANPENFEDRESLKNGMPNSETGSQDNQDSSKNSRDSSVFYLKSNAESNPNEESNDDSESNSESTEKEENKPAEVKKINLNM
jgi:hypothetical protein